MRPVCSSRFRLAFLVAGADRHRDRAQPDPLALRPAAGNAARDLGPVAGPAAGGALDLRRQQPRCRYAGLDERRHASRRADADLEPHVHHPVRDPCPRRADGRVCASLRFGLRMRAVTQNRRMAAAMGIRTPWIDALTFGLGSGVAGMAGVALSQIDNVSPNLGQSYIIDSFMVVVFGGVGNLWGTALGALSLGHCQQIPRTLCRRGARQDLRAGPADPVHPATPARPVPAQGAGGGGMMLDRTASLTLILLLGGAAVLAVLNLGVPPSSPLHVPTYVVGARREISVLRDAGAGDRSGLGVRRHPVARPCARFSRSAATRWACT